MHIDEHDKYTERPSVPLSPRLAALVNQARGELPRGTWLRDAVLEKLERDGYDTADDARRPVPRRRNYSERKGQRQ